MVFTNVQNLASQPEVLVGIFRSPGTQGPPGALPESIPANVVAFNFAGTNIAPGANDVNEALLALEAYLDGLFGSDSQGSNPYDLLYWDDANNSYVSGSLKEILANACPGVGDNDILAWDAANSNYIVTSAASLLSEELSAAIVPALTEAVPGSDDGDVLAWNDASDSYEPSSISDALESATNPNPNDVLQFNGADFVARNVQNSLTNGFPGNNANDVMLWNGSVWTPFPITGLFSTQFIPAMNSALPGAAPGDIPVWTGSGWGTSSFCATLDNYCPGSVVGDVLSWTGTSWTATPLNLGNALTSSFPAANAGDIVYNNGGAWVSGDICAVFSANCPGFNVGDVLYWSGNNWISQPATSLVNTGLNALFSACSPGQVLGCTGTGIGLTTLNLTDLGDTGVSPNAGEVVYFNGTQFVYDSVENLLSGGTASCVQVEACLRTSAVLGLPGTAGDLVFVNPAGNGFDSSPVLDYLDANYPAGISGQTCTPEMLLNDGTGWSVGKGVPEAPDTWAFPVAPQSHPLQLNVNPADGCLFWVARDHVRSTFTVPGDFPTLADFVTWAQGKSLNCVIDYNGTGEDLNTLQLNGYLGITGGGALGNVVLPRDSNVTVQLVNKTVNSLHSFGNQTILANGLTVVGENTATDGVRVITGGLFLSDGSSLTVLGALNCSGSTSNAVIVLNDSSLFVSSDMVVRNGTTGILISDSSSLRVDGDLDVQLASASGLQIHRSSACAISGNAICTNNGGDGAIAARCSTILVIGATTATSNGGNGIVSSDNSNVYLEGFTTTSQNGNTGILATRTGYIEVADGGDADVNASGILANLSGVVLLQSTANGDNWRVRNNTFGGIHCETGGCIYASMVTGKQIVATGNVHGVVLGANSRFQINGGGNLVSSNNTARGVWVSVGAYAQLGGTTTSHTISNNGTEGISISAHGRCIITGSGANGTTVTISGNTTGIQVSGSDSIFSRNGQNVNVVANTANFSIPVNAQTALGNLIEY